MADQDFFLKFGSNADKFAQDVKNEIGGARTELGLLSKAIREVNTAAQGSPTAKLVSGIRQDIKSAMGDVAKTIGQELRSALRGELKNLNINLDATVSGGGGAGGGRPSVSDVSHQDRIAAEKERQKQAAREAAAAKTSADAIAKQLEKATKDFQNELKSVNIAGLSDVVESTSTKVQGEARAALGALSIALRQIIQGGSALSTRAEVLSKRAKTNKTEKSRMGNQAKAEALQSDFGTLQGVVKDLVVTMKGLRDGTVDAQAASRKAVEGLERLAQARLGETDFEGPDPNELATSLERQVSRLLSGIAPTDLRSEEARPTQPGDIFGALGEDLVRAANTQATAASKMESAADQLLSVSQNFVLSGGRQAEQPQIIQPQQQAAPTQQAPSVEEESLTVVREWRASLDRETTARNRVAQVAESNASAVAEADQAAEQEADQRRRIARKLSGSADRVATTLRTAVPSEAEAQKIADASRLFGQLPDLSRLTRATDFLGADLEGFGQRPGGVGGGQLPGPQRRLQRERVLDEADAREEGEGIRRGAEEYLQALEQARLRLQRRLEAGLPEAPRPTAAPERVTDPVLGRFLAVPDIDQVRRERAARGDRVAQPDPEREELRAQVREIESAIKRFQNALSTQPSDERLGPAGEAAQTLAQAETRRANIIARAVKQAIESGVSLEGVEKSIAELPKDLKDAFRRSLAAADQELARGGTIPSEVGRDAEDRLAIREAARARDDARFNRDLVEQGFQAERERVAGSVGRLESLGIEPQTIQSIESLFSGIAVQQRDIQGEIQRAREAQSRIQSLQDTDLDESDRENVERVSTAIERRLKALYRNLETGAADTRFQRIRTTGDRPAISPNLRDRVIDTVSREQGFTARQGVRQGTGLLTGAAEQVAPVFDLVEQLVRRVSSAQAAVSARIDAEQALEAAREAAAAGTLPEEEVTKARKAAERQLERTKNAEQELATARAQLFSPTVGAQLGEGFGDLLQGRSLFGLAFQQEDSGRFDTAGLDEAEFTRRRTEALFAQAARAEQESIGGGAEIAPSLQGLNKAVEDGIISERRRKEISENVNATMREEVALFRRQKAEQDAAQRALAELRPTIEALEASLRRLANVDTNLIRQRLSTTQFSDVPMEAAAQLQTIGIEGGLSRGELENVPRPEGFIGPVQQRGVETVKDLIRVVERNIQETQEQTRATKEQEAATEGNTEAQKAALRAETTDPAARARVGRLSTQAAADLAQLLSGEQPVDTTEERRRRLREETGLRTGSFRGGADINDVFAEARGLVGETGPRVNQVRNFLGTLADVETQPGETISEDLIQAAAQMRILLARAASEREGVFGAISDEATRNIDNRMVTVLNDLVASMNKLSACCEAMQAAVRSGVAGPGGDIAAQARAQQKATSPLNLQGVLAKSINATVREAVAAEDPAARRRLLGQAALQVRADPTASGRFNDDQIIQVIKSSASALKAELSAADLSSARASLLDVQRLRGAGGQPAVEAFAAGDVDTLAERLISQTKDVEQTLRILRDVLNLNEEEVDQFRVGLERLVGTLTEAEQKTKQAAARESARDVELRRSQFAGIVPGFDPEDRSPEAIERTAGALLGQQGGIPDAKRLIDQLEVAYNELEPAVIRRINTLVEEEAAARRAAQSNQTYVQTLSSVLPQDQQRQFQSAVGTASTTGEAGRLVNQFVGGFEQATGQQANATFRRALSKLFQGVNLDKEGRNAVDKFARAGLTQLQTYQTPFQRFISQLFRGQSIVQASLSQAGFAISRFLGGSIIFGAINQMQQLGNIALETEQTFIRVQEALNATGRSADGLRTKLQDISIETNVQLADTVEVMAQLVGVFETTEEALAATAVVNQLELISQGALNAREGFRSLSAVASTFQEELTGRGLTDVEAIEYLADLTVRLQDLTGVNIEDTIEGLGRLGEQANSLNIEMELLASTIGLASKATGQTGQATSEQIGRILSNFQEVETQNLLVDLGITDRETVQAREFGIVLEDLLGGYEDLSVAQKRTVASTIGDPRQAAVTEAVLRRGAEALEIYEESFNNAGAAAERTERILGTVRGQIGQLGKQIQTFVQGLVDLGILTLFGVALKVAIEFLGVVNNILQVMNNLKEVSPFVSIATQVGIAIGTFAVLRTMLKGIAGEFLAINAAQTQLGNASTVQALIQSIVAARAGRRTPQQQPFIGPMPYGVTSPVQPFIGPRQRRFNVLDATGIIDPYDTRRQFPAPRRPPILQRSPLARGARSLSGVDDVSRPLGYATARMKESVEGVKESFRNARPQLAKFREGLTRMGPAIIGGALAIGLLVDLLTRAGREAQEYYANLVNTGADRQEGETEEEALARTRREEVDATVDAMKATDGFVLSLEGMTNRLKNLGEVINYATSNLGNMIDVGIGFGSFFNPATIALALSPAGRDARDDVGDALAGQSDEGDALIDQSLATMGALNRLRAAGDTDAALAGYQGLREDTLPQLEKMIDEAPTAAVAQTLQRYYETLEEATSNGIDALIAEQQDFQHAVDLDTRQIDAFLSALEGIEGFDGAALAKYAQDIQAAFIEGVVPPGAEQEIMGALTSGDFQSRLQAQSRALDFALDQARLELQQAEGKTPEEQEAAREQLQQVLQRRAELDQELLAQAVDIPTSFAEIALRRGDYARADALLSQALTAARQQAAAADPGSPEQAEALNQVMDLTRKKAEASIEEQVGALELAAIGLNDPIESIGNELETLQLKLQSAYDNPGAYTPEEIRAFITEIAQLQEQIADEQENIADAYDEYLASTANNEIARTAIEHQSALRRYRRALETGAGAAEVTQLATEVNEAARAQREAAESLRQARVNAQIAQIPEGDSLSRSLAELREAYRRQAAVIEEFGRNSAEFQETISDVIDAQRSAQEAARDIADATLAFAQSLAAAAGLDIRGARLSVQQAEAEVQRAIRDSGGRTDTAAVRQALAGLVDAQAALRDTVLGEALETVDFMLNMEEITEQQAIQVLQQILDTADLTEDQRRDLMSRIKGLKDAINQGVNEQFNLGEIRIPTPFEVRRALKVEEITQGLQDSVDAVVDLDAPTLPGDRIGPAPKGLLEDILGPDLASEVMGLGATGGNISQEIRNLGQGLSGDLLPPLEQIPKIIDAQLATRDEMVARSDMEIQTLVANNESLNSSIGQIGPTIAAPLELIHAAELASLELEAHSNVMMDEATAHLSNLASLTEGMAANIAALVDARSDWSGGMTEEGLKAWGDRYQAQADRRQVIHDNRTITVRTESADQVLRLMEQRYGTTAIQRETGGGLRRI